MKRSFTNFELQMTQANKDLNLQGFTGGSAGKKSACNSGDPSSICGLGRSPGEGNGIPF